MTRERAAHHAGVRHWAGHAPWVSARWRHAFIFFYATRAAARAPSPISRPTPHRATAPCRARTHSSYTSPRVHIYLTRSRARRGWQACGQSAAPRDLAGLRFERMIPQHLQPGGSRPKRRPGRPPTYVFDRPDSELTENERRLRSAVLKRRERQNRSYRRRKLLKSQQLAAASATRGSAPVGPRDHPPRPHHHPPQLPPPTRPRAPDLPLALLEPYSAAPAAEHPPIRPPLFLPRLHAPHSYARVAQQHPPPVSLPLPPPPQRAQQPAHAYETSASYGLGAVELAPRSEAPPSDLVFRHSVRAPDPDHHPQASTQHALTDSLALPFTSEPPSAAHQLNAQQLSAWPPKYEPQQHVHI